MSFFFRESGDNVHYIQWCQRAFHYKRGGNMLKNLRITIGTLIAATLTTVSLIHTLKAQTVEPLTPGKQVAQQTVVQSYTWQYWVYLPPTYDPAGTTRWPMIISLPPYNSTVQGGAFSDIIGNTIPYLLKTPATCKYVSDRFVVVAPYIKTVGYPQYADTMNALFRYLGRTLKVDTTRIDLFGTCAGGNIGYTYATKYPDLPASIVFFAINDGWSFPFDLTKACTIKNIPAKIYNADGDPYTPFAKCQSVVTTINACSGGGKAEFVLVHDNIHEIWRYVDTTKALYDWMLLQHKGATDVSHPAMHPRATSSPELLRSGALENAGVQIIAIDGKRINSRMINQSPAGQSFARPANGVYYICPTNGSRTTSRITLIR
jgi:hypothetical protein